MANLWLLRRVVDGLGPHGPRPFLARAPVLWLKLLLGAALAFVIIRVAGFVWLGALLGALAPVVAALFEAIAQLFYARARALDHPPV